MSEEHITDLKKISLTLRDINKEWTKDGDSLKVIARIVELDKKIYKKISTLEQDANCTKGEQND